jgi:hypothetical protein
MRQLPTFSTALLRLACQARHHVRGKIRDFDRRKDVAQFGDDVGFDGFDSDVVDEALEGNLMRGEFELVQLLPYA